MHAFEKIKKKKFNRERKKRLKLNFRKHFIQPEFEIGTN